MPADDASSQILFEVTTPGSAYLFSSLATACTRKGVRWACFFTNDGVRCLDEPEVRSVVGNAAQAVVCELSWQRFMSGKDCPVEIGSQTNNSRMLGDVVRVVSL